MENIILTPKEFVFLCAGMNVERVYGIIDAYKDVDRSDVLGEIYNVQKSLESKKYIESDFDGNSSVISKVIEYVNICAKCQKLITFDCHMKSGVKTNIVYYCLNDKVVKSMRKNGDYHLSYIEIDALSDEIKGNIKLDSINSMETFNQVYVPQNELDKIKNFVVKDNRVEAFNLINNYFDNNFSDIILNSMKMKENFYSVCAVNYLLKEDNIKNITVINSSKANIKIQPVVKDLRTMIEFEQIDENTVYAIVENCVNFINSK